MMLTHSEAGSSCESLRRVGSCETRPCQSQRWVYVAIAARSCIVKCDNIISVGAAG